MFLRFQIEGTENRSKVMIRKLILIHSHMTSRGAWSSSRRMLPLARMFPVGFGSKHGPTYVGKQFSQPQERPFRNSGET